MRIFPPKVNRKDHRSDLTQIASATSTTSLATSGRPVVSILFFLKYLNPGYRTAYSARMGSKRHNCKQMHSFFAVKRVLWKQDSSADVARIRVFASPIVSCILVLAPIGPNPSGGNSTPTTFGETDSNTVATSEFFSLVPCSPSAHRTSSSACFVQPYQFKVGT